MRDEKHIVLLFTCGTVYIIYIYISRNQIKYFDHTSSELQKKGVNSEVNEDMLRHHGIVAFLLYLSFAANGEEYA